jgi:hypothetical protein
MEVFLLAMCEQCNNDSKYSIDNIGLCEPCYIDYCEEMDIDDSDSNYSQSK